MLTPPHTGIHPPSLLAYSRFWALLSWHIDLPFRTAALPSMLPPVKKSAPPAGSAPSLLRPPRPVQSTDRNPVSTGHSAFPLARLRFQHLVLVSCRSSSTSLGRCVGVRDTRFGFGSAFTSARLS
ncbi:hypothetical protein BV20DRAFT_366997 [Pilatotrama ljubarskyi]|nr:hypothetical protein BV20DRAFT_366997 [Pilatotrama ljubarskyi]